MEKIKLKPCPFCGGEAEYFIVENFSCSTTRGWTFGIHCTECMVSLPIRDFVLAVDLYSNGEFVAKKDERQKDADMWNRRADHG